MTILVCDDEKEIVNAIEIYLKGEGYQVEKAYNGIQALDVVKKKEIHLIIMDIMMPEMDGIRATMKIREEKNIPVIMLSAKSEDYDKILGLNVGADDYVTKPFNPLELIARVKSQLRRYTDLGAMNKEEKSDLIMIGGLFIDDKQKRVQVDGQDVKLTPIQYKIVKLLASHPGRVFPIDEIYERVWGEDSFNPENTVAVHIRKIREQIEINPKEPRYLKVVWGVGYKMENLE